MLSKNKSLLGAFSGPFSGPFNRLFLSASFGRSARFTRSKHSARAAELAGCLFIAAILAGCAARPVQPAAAPAPAAPPASAPAVTAATVPVPVSTPVAAVVQANAERQPVDALPMVLAYADRVRGMPAAELSSEIARLSNGAAPAELLQLSLALSQLRQPSELARAQEVTARVIANNSAEAQVLHPLARLLASRYNELRRADEQLERQNQAVRDLQRRLEQTNERLEALKAIERSLTSRPAPVLQAPLPRGAASRPATGNGSAPSSGSATGNGRSAP